MRGFGSNAITRPDSPTREAAYSDTAPMFAPTSITMSFGCSILRRKYSSSCPYEGSIHFAKDMLLGKKRILYDPQLTVKSLPVPV